MINGWKGLRHFIDIKTPASGVDNRGQRTGSDVDYLTNIPCEIRNLSGRDAEIARQLFPTATVSIRMMADSSYSINANHVVIEQANSRRLAIGYVNDKHRNGVEIELLCSEIAT